MFQTIGQFLQFSFASKAVEKLSVLLGLPVEAFSVEIKGFLANDLLCRPVSSQADVFVRLSEQHWGKYGAAFQDFWDNMARSQVMLREKRPFFGVHLCP